LMLKVVLNVHCLHLKFSPLENICTTHGFVFYLWLHPQTLVLTFWKSPKTFSLIWNKISRKHIAHKNYPLLIAEKSAKQARHMFTLTDTAQGLS
jgi:hypothetical protein